MNNRFKIWETLITCIILILGVVFTILDFFNVSIIGDFSINTFIYTVIGITLVMHINYIFIVSRMSDLHKLSKMSEDYKAGMEFALEKRENYEKFDSFQEGFKLAIEMAIKDSNTQTIECIDIFARNGTNYGGALNFLDRKIKEINLLVASDSILEENKHRKFSVEAWNRNVQSVISYPLDTYLDTYDFVPTFHFAIINKKWLFYGNFPPDECSDNVSDVFLTSMETPLGRSVLNICQNSFDVHHKNKKGNKNNENKELIISGINYSK